MHRRLFESKALVNNTSRLVFARIIHSHIFRFQALELMEPKCESNRELRAQCHARRGAALCKLSSPQHGIPELKVALELAPDNETIKRDVLAAKQYFDIND